MEVVESSCPAEEGRLTDVEEAVVEHIAGVRSAQLGRLRRVAAPAGSVTGMRLRAFLGYLACTCLAVAPDVGAAAAAAAAWLYSCLQKCVLWVLGWCCNGQQGRKFGGRASWLQPRVEANPSNRRSWARR